MLPFAAFFPTALTAVVQTFLNYNAGTQTVSVPAGARQLAAEAIGGGAACVVRRPAGGGSGGHYARRNAFNVVGLGSVNVTPGGPGQASIVTDPSGNTIVAASQGAGQTGNSAGASTGDVVYVGGSGAQGDTAGGGGAGGPNGPGANASGSTGGIGGGGIPSAPGYGGGGGASGGIFGGGAGVGSDGAGNNLLGGQGWIRLTWSF